jgi:catechol 2,3-dioxygenase-like lactoylglutathione lyase family enzyme
MVSSPPEPSKSATPLDPLPKTRDFYVDVLKVLDAANLPYLVGGGYAMAHYTGIARTTKDLDLFIQPIDRDRTLALLAKAGYRTEFFFPFWISKAIAGDAFIDLLYNSGNGLCPVDQEWFAHAGTIDVHGYPTRLCPPEETLWSKAFVQDRDRFDGADVIHLILCRGKQFDWDRLIRRFQNHERVLLAHLLLFDYSFPSERDCVPREVMDRLGKMVAAEPTEGAKICRGTMLAQRSYDCAVRKWGYLDGRLQPHGPLTPEQLAQVTKP